MKIFWTYYILSGIIMMAFVHRKYDKIIKDIPLVEYIPREVLALLQFFTGFLQFPFCIPLWLKLFFTNRRIKKLQRQIEERKKLISHLEDVNKNLKEINSKYKNKQS